MPTTIYDSSLITQRRRDKAISGSFINRIQNPIDPTTGYAPLLGISEQSIINTVKNGQMTTYRKNDGGCTTESLGCPCLPTPIINSPTICLKAQWATSFIQNPSATTDVSISGITTDSSNNIYVSGYYRSDGQSVTLMNVLNNSQTPSLITLPLTGLNIYNVFLAKYNSEGISQWATNIPTLSNGFYGFANNIVIDNADNIIITGGYYTQPVAPIFLNNASNNSQIASTITLRATSNTDSFLVKYNPLGTAIWATTIGTLNQSDEQGTSLVVDSLNNIYMLGYYRNPGLINNTKIYNASVNTQVASSITLPNVSNRAVYLVKYNIGGSAQWATYLDGTGPDRGISITIDSSNDIYFTGNYNSNTAPLFLYNASGNGQVISPLGISLPQTNTSGDCYLVKYNTSGQAIWATYLNGTLASNELGFSVKTDTLNNVYILCLSASNTPITVQDVSGNTQTPSSIVIPSTPIASTTQSILVKYNSSGKAQWGTYISSSSNYTQFVRINIDSFNNIYVSGEYLGSNISIYNSSGISQSLSSITLQPTVNNLYTNLFSGIIKYNSDGIAQCATCIGDLNSDLGLNKSFSTAKLPTIYISGSYVSPSSVTINNTSQNGQIKSLLTLPAANTGTFLNSNGYIVKYTIG